MSDFAIQERQVPGREDITILDLSGLSPVFGPNINSAVERLLEKGKTKIILNLSALELIDSGSIQTLRTSSLEVQKRGQVLRLPKPSRFVAGYLATTGGVLDLCHLFYDEQKAIDSFN